MKGQIVIWIYVGAEQRFYDVVNGFDEPQCGPDGNGGRGNDHNASEEITPETLCESRFGGNLGFNDVHPSHFALLDIWFKTTLMRSNHGILVVPNTRLGLGFQTRFFGGSKPQFIQPRKNLEVFVSCG